MRTKELWLPPSAIPFRSSDKEPFNGGRGGPSSEYPTGEHPWRKLYSRITESSTWRSLTAKQIAVWICAIAKSHSQDKDLICQQCGAHYTAPRGSYSHSTRWTAMTCGVDKNTVLRAFKALENVGFWTKQGRGCHVYYLINKFEEYQQTPTDTQTEMHPPMQTDTHPRTQTNIKEVEVEVEVEMHKKVTLAYTRPDLMVLAEALRKSILNHKCDYQNLDKFDHWKRVVEKWLGVFDLIERKDERSPQRQLAVLKWLSESKDRDAEFWRPNILSPKKFRQHFDRLEVAMQRGPTRKPATFGRTEQLVIDGKADDWNKEIL